MKPDISIIYVNWNSSTYLKQSLRSVVEQTRGITFEIIVVDNASPDDHCEGLEESYEPVQLIRLAHNRGFAHANNIGSELAKSDTLLFLNPDTIVLNRAITTLWTEMTARPEAGIIGGKLLNSDNSVQSTSIRPFPSLLGHLLTSNVLIKLWPTCPLWGTAVLLDETRTSVETVEAISGACMMVRKAVFEKLGRFCEEYFMYSEDIDLCYQAVQAGYYNYYVPTARIVHYGGASSSQEAVSSWSAVMQSKARLKFFERTRGVVYGQVFRVCLVATAGCRMLLAAILWGLFSRTERREGLIRARTKWLSVLRWAVCMDT